MKNKSTTSWLEMGINKLFERRPEGEKRPRKCPAHTKRMVPDYYQHNADKAAPPGITELLKIELQTKGVQLAVASNKYQAATEKLIAHYFPTIRFIAVFGQREGVNVKPDPTVIYDILKIAKHTAKVWAYPLTWGISSVIFLYLFLRGKWVYGFEKS